MDKYYIRWNQDGSSQRFNLQEEKLFIGRRSDSNIVLVDPYVSRRHAQLMKIDQGYKIVDLKSTHGTFINGMRIREQALKEGDKIQLGRGPSQLTYLVDSELDQEMNLTLEQSVLQFSAVLHPASKEASELEKISHILDFQYQWGQTFSADRTLEQLLKSALRISGAERGFLLTPSDSDLDYVVGMTNTYKLLSENEFRTSKTVVEQVVERGESLFMTEGIDQEFAAQESIVSMQLRAVACLPLKWISADSELPSVKGILYLDSRKTMHTLSGLDQKILARLALEASNVFEKLELIQNLEERRSLQQELALAQSTQRSLLPREIPHSEAFVVHASSTPTRYVGGDYYDFLSRAKKELTAVLADVSGKGVSAALLSSFLQGVLEVECALESSLGQVLTRVNEYLHQKTQSNRFVTLFLFSLEASGKGEYISAGHNPAYVFRKDAGEIEELPSRGLILGAFEGVTYDSTPFCLEVGDVLVVYSDGVTEAMNRVGEMFGEEQLIDVILGSARFGAMTVQTEILSAVKTFMGQVPAHDDITVLVVERVS